MKNKIYLLIFIFAILGPKLKAQSVGTTNYDSSMTLRYTVGYSEIDVYTPFNHLTFKPSKGENEMSLLMRYVTLYRKRGWKVISIYNLYPKQTIDYYLEK